MTSSTPLVKTLTLSLNKHLHGTSILPTLTASFNAVTTSETQSRFDNLPFDVDPTDPTLITKLKADVRSGKYDGVLIGWCLRGYTERTELFEQIVNVIVESKDTKTKLMFCTGPDDLGRAIVRNLA